MKAFFSHPMSWMLTVYCVAFTIAFFLFGLVALIHPLGVTAVIGGFLYSCYNSEQDSNIKNAIRRKL